MLLVETIILYCLQKLNSDRTIYSVFHLLNGKKSSQTLQDAHLFSLKRFFGIYDTLTREAFDEIIESLFRNQWIYRSGEQRYLLTHSGKLFLEKNPLPSYLDGWSYYSFTSVFWERLALFIQVTSNLVYGESRYLPIQKNKDAHRWMKSSLKQLRVPKNELGKIVCSELIECLNDTKDINPSNLVFRLTGFQQIGLTPHQLMKRLNSDIHNYQIGFIQTLHYLIQTIQQNPKRFSVLTLLMHDFQQQDELTHSSRKTWKLLNQGYSPESIAEFRQLKLSTIEDHLVEFALNVDDFSVDPYVDNEFQKRILEISRQNGTRQLKLIKDQIESATYFQIRLVLAKYGDR